LSWGGAAGRCRDTAAYAKHQKMQSTEEGRLLLRQEKAKQTLDPGGPLALIWQQREGNGIVRLGGIKSTTST